MLGDPLANRDAKEIIKELIDVGADCIDLPAQEVEQASVSR